MVKGGVVGLGLASAALFWVFGGRAWDLVSAKAEKGKEWARSQFTSFDDEIMMTRKLVEKLGPAIGDGAEALAKLEASVRESEADVEAKRQSLAALERRVEVLSANLPAGSVHRVSGSAPSSSRSMEVNLAKTIDSYNQTKRTVGYAEDALAYRKAQVQEARARLDEMKAKRQTLISKINEIEARHKARIASRQFNEFTIDASPLAEAEKAVAQLDTNESVDARADELKTELSDEPTVPSSEDTSRDVRREAEEILKSTGTAASSADRDA
jgi:chromosome segregation ATPase